MPLPLIPIALGLGAAKMGVDAYTGFRQMRADRRLRHRQEENQETQDHDARGAAIMRSLGIDAPTIPHQLQSLGNGTDLTGENIASGLLGFGSNAAAMGAAVGRQAGPTDVPVPYQQQNYPSAYGPGSRIKPGTPYR